ncbi:hypothetical protein BGZ63DRAFT_418951 [Mariannaea sp. PMI_226]|nr:hypothetical protein BGZ63DRAFT_418951 [Mariannaea sp. PMI_226]
MAGLLHLFSSILILVQLSLAADTVSISEVLPSDGHKCLEACLFDHFFTDMGKAMGCDTPYENACYCATESASVSVADTFMSRCGSTSCARGDYTRDLKSMQSLYASYCMGAGFKQPGATKWYNPATATEEPSSSTSGTEQDTGETDAQPSKTADPGAAETTTQLTIVTQTTEGGSGATKSRIVVQATSTLWVNPDGSLSSSDGHNSKSNSSVKIGVGVAVPVAAILIAALGWWFWRRRRGSPNNQPSPETGITNTSVAPPPMGSMPINRKPVNATVPPHSKINELSDAVKPKGEIDGQEVQFIPTVATATPTDTTGRHEVNGDSALRPEMDGQSPRGEISGEGRPSELPGQTQSPPPGYTHASEQPVQRWELPASS